MKRLAIFLLLLGAALCWFGSTRNQEPEPNQELDPAEKKQQTELEAIEALEKLGATVSSRRAAQAGGYCVVCRAPITDADLVHLKSIGNLRELKFTKEIQITDAGLVQIAELTELSYLSLHGTQITDDGLRYLKRLPKLQILSLDNTAISDAGLLHLQDMCRLGRLDLSPQTIDAVLRYLIRKSSGTVNRYSEITDTLLEHLVDLKSLASGEDANAPPADALLERLQTLARLASLDAADPEVIDDLLEYLTSLAGLKELSLPDQVTDAGLSHLKGLTNLQTLYLGNSRVTDAGVAELQKTLPNCKIHH